MHLSNIKAVVSVYGSIKTRGNVLPVETCSAQICGFHIDHIAGSFSLIFAIVINIPSACCLVHTLGARVRFQNPLEAISSFITISHSLPPPPTPPPCYSHTPVPPELTPRSDPMRPSSRECCHLTELRSITLNLLKITANIKLSLITSGGKRLKTQKGNQMSLMIG